MDRNQKVYGRTGEKVVSHSARGAWIETVDAWLADPCIQVALREGCVDRNLILTFDFCYQVCRTPRGVRG